MKILFYYRGRENLAIEYLSSILKNAGHQIDLIFDPGFDNTHYYRNKLLKIFNTEDLLIQQAKSFNPDLIAFSSNTNEYPFVSRMAQILKKATNAPILVGGLHPTVLPEVVINNPYIDIICRGEGEEAILELANLMEENKDFYKTKNFWFKQNNQIIQNDVRPLIENLDTLPFPDKELFFKYGCGKESLSVITNRGCPLKCSYCVHEMWHKLYKDKGHYTRVRTVNNVIAELKSYLNKYKVKRIFFQDDHFITKKEWLREFSEKYSKEINKPFFCNIFPGNITEEVCSLLKEAGCDYLYIGIDSANEKTRRDICNRHISQNDIKKKIAIVKKHKIPMELSMVFGWPGETPEDMWASAELINELNPKQLQCQILYPYPGTKILEYCIQIGLVDDKILEKIYQGEGNMIKKSFLHHPFKDLAYSYSKLLPLYVKSPKALKPLIKWLMHSRIKTKVNIIYITLIPLLYPLLAWVRIKELLSMLKVTIQQRLFKRLTLTN